ncbi:terminase small subunit [Fibrella sp. ES10-3-2-2]|nr:hypothetical protein A6C57_01005 [Fibrella sp. ES10-3-2-2]
MTDIQQRFIEEYIIDGNGAAAARRAGYSPATARQKAYELLSDETISAEVKKRLNELSMTAEEAVKHFTDIARTRLNDFMVIRQVQGYEQSEQYVTVLLESAREEIKTIQDFITAQGLKKKEQRPFLKQISALQLQCLDYQTEINRFGNDVTRLAPGRPCIIEVAEIDLVALARAKETGRIKSYAVTKDGFRVEMFGADGALGKILEYHGKLSSKHEVIFPQLDNLTPDQLDQLRRLQEAASPRE